VGNTSLVLGALVVNTSRTITAVNTSVAITADVRATFGLQTAALIPPATTALFSLTFYGRIETSGAALVAADNVLAGSFQNSATQNGSFGLRGAIAFTAVPLSTSSFSYTELSATQRLKIGDTLYISQKQSSSTNVWNHYTALVTAVLTGPANSTMVRIGTFTMLDGTTAGTQLLFTQALTTATTASIVPGAQTDVHVVFYGDQVTVALGTTTGVVGGTAVTGLKTALAGNTASTLNVGSISMPSAASAASNVFKDATTNPAGNDIFVR
jgi:hypothetical protein